MTYTCDSNALYARARQVALYFDRLSDHDACTCVVRKGVTSSYTGMDVNQRDSRVIVSSSEWLNEERAVIQINRVQESGSANRSTLISIRLSNRTLEYISRVNVNSK